MTTPRRTRRPEANATGPRPKPAAPDKDSGKAVRMSPEAKNLVMEYAIRMSARQGRLVSMREALDEIVFFWRENHNEET